MKSHQLYFFMHEDKYIAIDPSSGNYPYLSSIPHLWTDKVAALHYQSSCETDFRPPFSTEWVLHQFYSHIVEPDEPTFENYYECPRCSYHWVDKWSASCDDDCPKCGMRHISPYESVDL